MNAPVSGQASVPAQILHSMREVFAPDVPEALAAAAKAVRDASPSPALRALREAGWKAFEALGVPGTKHEDYSYVSAADLKFNLTRAPEAGKIPAWHAKDVEVFDLSKGDAPAALLEPWTALAEHENDAPAAQAWALAPHPFAFRVPGSAKVSLRLHFHAQGRADHALFIRLEPGAQAVVFLETEAAAEAFSNGAIAFSVGEGARLSVLQQDAPQGVQMLKLRFALEKDARAELLAVSTGSRLARLALEADLLAPGAEVDLRGAAAPGGQGRVHRHLRLRHASPDCRSSQLFKAVVPAAGRSSVDGTVTVDRGAQRTDARQLLQHLLLSPDARADAKPRLLIHADDVKCSHGATVGKTDPAQKFYLLSRGLDSRTADRLLTQAFLNEALELFPEDATAGARARLMDAVTGAAK
jgi:Fe-S cluster assembly protein SufD